MAILWMLVDSPLIMAPPGRVCAACSCIEPVCGVQASTTVPDAASIALLEGQLTWLTHIVGAILRGRLNQSSVDTQARASSPRPAAVVSLHLVHSDRAQCTGTGWWQPACLASPVGLPPGAWQAK